MSILNFSGLVRHTVLYATFLLDMHNIYFSYTPLTEFHCWNCYRVILVASLHEERDRHQPSMQYRQCTISLPFRHPL